jgi:hypothetical protein
VQINTRNGLWQSKGRATQAEVAEPISKVQILKGKTPHTVVWSACGKRTRCARIAPL